MDVLYSQEERNKIEETIKFIVNDLITLWENAQPEAVTIETRYLSIEYTSYLTIDKKGLTLRTYSKFYSDYDYIIGPTITDINYYNYLITKYTNILKNIPSKYKDKIGIQIR